MTRGTNPASLANLQPANRAQTGAWSIERGKPLPMFLPWKPDVEAMVTDYADALAAELEPECHLCAALALSAARARGALACVEAAGREYQVPMASKGGVRKLWRDAAWWEDRWLARVKELDAHRREAHEECADPLEHLRQIGRQSVAGGPAA